MDKVTEAIVSLNHLTTITTAIEEHMAQINDFTTDVAFEFLRSQMYIATRELTRLIEVLEKE